MQHNQYAYCLGWRRAKASDDCGHKAGMEDQNIYGSHSFQGLSNQLSTVAQIRPGSKLGISENGDPYVESASDLLTGVRRWFTGQNRRHSLVWLEGLAQRVKELASHQMQSAHEADEEGGMGQQRSRFLTSSSIHSDADVCPQCLRPVCGCMSAGEHPEHPTTLLSRVFVGSQSVLYLSPTH